MRLLRTDLSRVNTAVASSADADAAGHKPSTTSTTHAVAAAAAAAAAADGMASGRRGAGPPDGPVMLGSRRERLLHQTHLTHLDVFEEASAEPPLSEPAGRLPRLPRLPAARLAELREAPTLPTRCTVPEDSNHPRPPRALAASHSQLEGCPSFPSHSQLERSPPSHSQLEGLPLPSLSFTARALLPPPLSFTGRLAAELLGCEDDARF